MKYLPSIAGVLLGLLFVFASAAFFFQLFDVPAPPAGSPPALFMGALVPTGYMHFVKSLELLGGILVAIPLTRNIGLLVLGPIIINILAFNVFLTNGKGLTDPMLVTIVILAAYLLWCERRAFACLLHRRG